MSLSGVGVFEWGFGFQKAVDGDDLRDGHTRSFWIYFCLFDGPSDLAEHPDLCSDAKAADQAVNIERESTDTMSALG